MVDTCQAASMYEKFYSPNILAVASSLVGEDSLSVSKFRICYKLSDFMMLLISIHDFEHFLFTGTKSSLFDRALIAELSFS